MLLFWIICALMVVFTFWFVLPPLFQSDSSAKPDTARDANLLVYQDQHRKLEADLKTGLLSEAQYQKDKEELERRLLDDLAANDQSHTRRVTTRKLGYTLAVALPIAVIIFYLAVGNPAALNVAPASPAAPASR